MSQRWIAVAACAAAVGALSTPRAAHGQLAAPKASDPRGVYLHGHVEAVQFDPEDAGTERGFGGGVQVGYNFTRYLGAFAGFDYARHGAEGGDVVDDEVGIAVNVDDHARFTHAELGVRLNVPIGATLLPYADVAYARRTFAQDFSIDDGAGTSGDGTVELRGDNVLVGLGFQYFFRPALAFDVGGRLSMGSFDELKVSFDGQSESTDEDLEGKLQFGRLTAGLTWYPGGARRPR
jgi:hypothetical protein